jgi:hypothetical protein
MADATIVNQTGKDVQDPMTLNANRMTHFVTDDPNLFRTPEFYVYLFNICPKEFVVYRPPLLSKLVIHACPEGQTYIKALRLPDIVNQCWQDADTGQARTRGFDGRKVAMDVINPNNLTLNQDAAIDANTVFSDGNDLSKFGVFWSLNEVPTEAELANAKKKLEATLRQLLTQGDGFDRGNKRELLTEMHYMADNYFKAGSAWNRIPQVPVDCPNCGLPIRKGQAYHAIPDLPGKLCVIDWDKTIKAGVMSEEDRPKTKRAKKSDAGEDDSAA